MQSKNKKGSGWIWILGLVIFLLSVKNRSASGENVMSEIHEASKSSGSQRIQLESPGVQMPEQEDIHWALVSRDQGACGTLTGDVAVGIFFVDDPESSWSEQERQQSMKTYSMCMNNVMAEAADYAVPLNIRYFTENITIGTAMSKDTHRECAQEILKNSGLKELNEASRSLEKGLGVKEVPLVFCFNKPGRSFACSSYGGYMDEYVVMYQEKAEDSTSLKHELYHLFGAKDLYGSGGTKQTGVWDIAVNYWPEGIMIGDSDWTDPLTAYLIGWTETPSDAVTRFLEESKDLTESQRRDVSSTENGFGTREMADGTYEGDLVNGMYHGYGIYHYSDGTVYEGQWESGRWNGRGVFRYADGSCYDGEWVQGRRQGSGKMTYANGDVYIGDWMAGNRDGYGVYLYHDGGVYEGNWTNGKRNGSGVMTYADGTVYEGNWVDSNRSGSGRMVYVSGNVYEGNWSDGNAEGWGVKWFADGGYYEGYWSGGYFHGTGTQIYPSGAVRQGNFNMGSFVG